MQRRGTTRQTATLILLLGLTISTSASAVITFTQLDDAVFTVSHRVKAIGSRGKATKMVYIKAASLCVAAGYSYYQVLDQESAAAQEYESANATVRVRFHLADGSDRIDCAVTADPQYVDEARAKLRSQGYAPPDRTAAPEADASAGAPEAPEPEGRVPGSCTIEQIAAMARAGLTDEQIRAACP